MGHHPDKDNYALLGLFSLWFLTDAEEKEEQGRLERALAEG